MCVCEEAETEPLCAVRGQKKKTVLNEGKKHTSAELLVQQEKLFSARSLCGSLPMSAAAVRVTDAQLGVRPG